MAIDEKKLREVLRNITAQLPVADYVKYAHYDAIDEIFTEELQTKKPLKIEVGKKYRTKCGSEVVIIEKNPINLYKGYMAYCHDLIFNMYTENGKCIHNVFDLHLIEEVE